MSRTPIGMSNHGTTAGAQSDATVAWRTERLIAAGCSPTLARSLAGDCGYDLHALLSLLDRGCPAELAARIIAPLEEMKRPC
jgi:hypothetical protein